MALAARAVDLLPDDLDKMEGSFSSLAKIFFGHRSWFGLISLKLESETSQGFAGLAPFFLPDAPLAELDEAVSDAEIFQKALPLFQTAPTDHPAIRFVRHLLDCCRHDGDEDRELLLREHLGAMMLAAVAHVHERPQPVSLDSETALRLICSDVKPLPWHEMLAAMLRKAPRDLVATELIARLKETRHTWGEVHIAKFMGELAYPEFSEALIGAVSEEAGSFICEKAQEALVCIGEPALPALLSRWDDFDPTQRIYLFAAIQEVGGTPAADFVHARFAELKTENLEFTLDCLLSIPERRHLTLLAPELKRRQHLIDRAYVVLCLLLGELPEDFAALEARVLEDRRVSMERCKRFAAGNLKRDTLLVEMRCTACNEVNTYEIRQLYLDGEGQAEPLAGEEFPCASCGAYTEFELTGAGRMAVMSSMIMLGAGQGSEQRIVPRDMLQFVDMPFEGRPHAINEIIALCRERLANDPGDARSLLIQGIVYGITGHHKKALERLHRAHSAVPHAAEALYLLARQLVARGQENAARELLVDLPTQAASLQFILADSPPAKETAGELMRLYNMLRPDGAPALHPGAIATPAKAGRNDPCPCGSGKKHKKCCGSA